MESQAADTPYLLTERLEYFIIFSVVISVRAALGPARTSFWKKRHLRETWLWR